MITTLHIYGEGSIQENAFEGNSEIKNVIIDRFEGEYAVCEKSKTKEMIDIKIEDLPEGSKEGTVLKLKNGKYEIDLEEQKKIEDRIKQKMDSLWNN